MYNDIDSRPVHGDLLRDERESDGVGDAVAFARSNPHVEKC
jgi:hypothetical protein